MITINAAEVLARATDPAGPGANDYWDRLRAGGTTAFAATTGMGQFPAWYRRFREDADSLIHVTSAEDVRRADADGKLGVIFHLQKPGDLEGSPERVEILYRLGVRMMQLTYNDRSLFGDGCTERGDGGLSDLGAKVVAAMNAMGMLVDVTHAGPRTARDIVEASSVPVIASHSNADAVCPNPRNLSDELMLAIAAGGGMVGVTAFPSLVRWQEPTIEQFLDHIDYITDLIGRDRVGFGLDFCQIPQESWDSGRFSPKAYPPPPWVFPDGLAGPEDIPDIAEGLRGRGYDEASVRGIMGENLLRLFEHVWKPVGQSTAPSQE